MPRGPSPSAQVAPATMASPARRRTSRSSSAEAANLAHQRTQLRTLRDKSRQRVTWRQGLCALNHWGSLALVVVLVASQFACIFWSSQTTDQYMLYGQDPTQGIYHIDGLNDEPFSDRTLVCVRQGRLYRPMQLSSLLVTSSLPSATATSEIVDTTGVAISGYRVIPRQQIGLDDTVAQRYALACDLIAATLPRIVAVCRVLGYNVVEADDELRVVNGVFSNVTERVPSSLPVLIMPFWDNAIFARYAIPGTDGSACMAHLSGLYDSTTERGAWVRSISRSVREGRTEQWLGIHKANGAAWRNGWLEDPTTGQRWSSDILGSIRLSNDKYLIRERQFDVLTNKEVNCTAEAEVCHPTALPEWWGRKFYSTDDQMWYNSVAVSNGSRDGLFLYEAMHRSTIHSVYDIATLISNTTVALLLFRWFAAGVALLNAYRRGYSREFSTPGIGCLACTRNFELLPLILLPRVTTVLAAFFTAGCKFEGEQRAISEAWFVIYPAIAELMLYYYSLLNLVAKVLRCRMSDALFGPSLALLCLLHWLRLPLANSGFFEFDGRISTVMTANEYEKLRFFDFFTTDAALRLNGNVWSIFAFKLAVLVINLLPLVVAQKLRLQPWAWDDAAQTATQTMAIERALGVRASESAGLGMSLPNLGRKITVHTNTDKASEEARRRMNCYELVRLGYIVFGDVVVMTVTEWLTLVLFASTRSRTRESNYRVLAFRMLLVSPPPTATRPIECDCDGGGCTMELDGWRPMLYQINDPMLLGANVWDIAAVPLP